MSGELESSLFEMQEGLRNALRAFATYFTNNWQIETEEEWKKAYRDPYPGDEFRKAFNAGVESIDIALDIFLDEELH